MKNIYKYLFMLFLSVNFTLALHAQAPTFFNNNVNSPSNSFPWATAAGKETQYLIAPGEITGSYYGNITTVYFQVTPSLTNTWTSLTIKLGQTSITSLPASIYTGPLTTCYFASSVTNSSNASGWLMFNLQIPFTYDPTLSLIVDVSNCSATNTSMLTTNVGKTTQRRNYINAASCVFTYSGQDANVFNFGIDETTASSNGPVSPPIAGYAYNILTDTVWINSPYIFTNTSNNIANAYWDITGYCPTIAGTYTPYTAPRKCVARWNNTCYIDTSHINFTWTFTQRGYYKLKLKAQDIYYVTVGTTTTAYEGVDSITKIIYVDTPSAKPIASFFSDRKTVGFTDQLNYFDLSLNGPTQWSWSLNPPFIGLSTFAGSGLPNSWTPGSTAQNPQLYALDGGVFDVCLMVWNARGMDSLCRKNYLTVNNGYMMCNGSDSVSKLSSGYVYDAGGPTGNYTIGTTGNCPAGFRIAPCADTVILYVERFKLLAGDSVEILKGGPSGPRIKKLGGTNLPDSMKNFRVAGGVVFLKMTTSNAAPSGDSGFAIRWTSTPASYGKPKAGFTCPTTIYTGYTQMYSNTSTGANMNYKWDTNGDGIFGLDNPLAGIDSIAANPSRLFTTPGVFNVCLVTYNCVGADTTCKQITVLPLANKPVADFTVNKTTGFTTDTFRFFDISTNGPNQWQWTFNPANVAYLNGTSSTSQNPVVFLNSATCYTVTLKATNSMGFDTRIKANVACANTYTSPGTQNIIPSATDIGISRVKLGTIDTTTALQTPTYLAMYNQQKTTLYRGVDYTLTTYRLSNTDPMTTKVWIDYNMNAVFTDASETLINETRQYKISTSKTFRIPDNNPTGNTRMRVGISYDLTTLTPDYAQIGCFEDYGIIIGTDYIPPVVTLKGNAIHKIQVGSPYIEPGYIATDNLEGDITNSGRVTVSGSVNINVVGYYTLTYTATDLYGNVSFPVNRIVQVEVDQNGPTVTLNGSDTVYVGVKTNYIEQGAKAKDHTGHDITNLLTISGTVNVNELGTYILTYNVIDAFGFAASRLRKVIVMDTTKPVITSVTGKDTIKYQIGTPYIDMVNVTDNYWTNITYTRTGSINVNVIGAYTLLYNATDGSGNIANTYVLVIKIDNTIAPVVKLNGDADMTVDVNTIFSDPGVNKSSSYYTNPLVLQTTITPLGAPNMNKLGTVVMTYTVCDPSNNCTSVTRTVHVVDRIAPTITLLGANPYYHPRFQPYVDPGVLLSDNYYTDAQMRTSLFNMDASKVINDKPGVYFVTYDLTDPSGNAASQESRIVIIEEKVTSGISSVTDNGRMKLYPNPNNGKFAIDIEEGMNIQTVKVYNIIGSLVKEQAVKATDKTIEVNMTGASEGVYMVKMEGAGKTYMEKISVVK